MYLYFFDLDDTICNTGKIVRYIMDKNGISKDHYEKEKDFYIEIEERLTKHGFENIDPLNNSTMAILRKLVDKTPNDIYYITARESRVREQSNLWLKKHDLYLGEDKLIMDTQGIKGKTIDTILSKSDRDFAFLFDDLLENHEESAKYKNIISCLPF